MGVLGLLLSLCLLGRLRTSTDPCGKLRECRRNAICGALDLSGCKLGTVNNKLFKGLKFLMVINLSHCRISTVEEKTFSGLPNLLVVNLSYNELKSIPVNTFSGLSEMEILDFGHNQINYIAPGTFSKLTLRRLILNFNNISFLLPGALATVSLESLELQRNPLPFITEDVIKPFPEKIMLGVSLRCCVFDYFQVKFNIAVHPIIRCTSRGKVIKFIDLDMKECEEYAVKKNLFQEVNADGLEEQEPKNILESHKNEQHEPITEEEHDECEDDMELSHDGPEDLYV
ncbi:immunoglobulin superfamily containing leucine-rich repeat protein-like isoform X2 [Zophobas morio]|uniref:immunoglobulin superfamily containing leucine-rich repeat protein-like isoform X2 n=1 Tax=Zophobas morio TaxID=2755281 RepID=UPI00308394D4